MGPFLFAEIKTGCRKAQSEGYGSVLERARSTPLRVASPESSAALGQRFCWTAAAEALRVATGKAPPAWLRFASLCAARDSGPLVGRPAMLLWQQRALECAAGPQFAVGHSRTSRLVVILVVILVAILVVILVVSSEASSVSYSR